MSGKVLEALTSLLATITKQDGGVTELEHEFVIKYFREVLDKDSVDKYTKLYEDVSEFPKALDNDPMPMKESVRILRYCREINKDLELRQKILILIKLLELRASDRRFTQNREQVISTVADTFNIVKDEYKLIENFVKHENSAKFNFTDILVVNSVEELQTVVIEEEPQKESSKSKKKKSKEPERPPRKKGTPKHVQVKDLQGEIMFLRVENDLLFVKYTGNDQNVLLNGSTMKTNQIYLFLNGSAVKTPVGKAFYYGDVLNAFLDTSDSTKLSFEAKEIEFRFPNGAIGVQKASIIETQGNLIGIMGGSGAGKTTMLNVLAGLNKPAKGSIKINGYDIFEDKDEIEGVIGYIAQDDLLIEELTVYQNLYYNAKLCFKNLNNKEIDERVMKTLADLGLDHIRHLKVGNPLNKKISGGQRKRLNIALELIREPSVLFVDEPTSGLSSRDSENVIDLLKELSYKGKIIFVVIHQPSLDIYKMFDKMIFMDKGGYLIYYGPPLDSFAYFKEAAGQLDKRKENPEEVFNIIEAEVVDEYGKFTGKRKMTPQQWNQSFKSKFKSENIETIEEKPPSNLKVPNKFTQTVIFTIRDFLSKIGNTQYVLINILEAPILAFVLAYVIRFQNEPTTGDYVFRYNDNVPAYVLICIIIALFMGLTVSAEEIIKDRKIQKRETFLNLSRMSYLFSKLIILFLLSAIQTFLFVLVGNLILNIQGELINYWLMLFAVSCFANVLGLNISATFNSVITIYITIPILLIPQMILSGIIFRYEKMNNVISEKGTVPLLADFMVSRWAFEGIAVKHYKNNAFEREYFDYDKKQSIYSYKNNFWRNEMDKKLQEVLKNHQTEEKNDSIKKELKEGLALLRAELKYENDYPKLMKKLKLKPIKELTIKKFNEKVFDKVKAYLDSTEYRYQDSVNTASKDRDKVQSELQNSKKIDYDLNEYKDTYFNDGLDGFVRNAEVINKIVEQNGRFLQMMDPVFNEPSLDNRGSLNYRTHFLAPKKPFFGGLYDTYYFNMAVIWFLTLVLYFTLYFNFFKGIGQFPGRVKLYLKNRKKSK